MVALARPFLIACLLTSPALAADKGESAGASGNELVTATLHSDAELVKPGSSFTLGVHLKMKPHWHTYWVNAGESGEPTSVKLKGPAGVTFGSIQWPVPSKIISFDAVTYAYENEVMLLIPVQVGKDAKLDGAAIEAHVTWLSCHDTCVEGEAKLSLELPVKSPATPNKELFATWRGKLPIDQEDKASPIVHVKQPFDKKTAPMPTFNIEWKEAPGKVDFFPISTRAVAIENVTVKHEDKKSTVQFKPVVYKPDLIPGGRVFGVIVTEDEKGNRRGIVVPFKVDTSDAVK